MTLKTTADWPGSGIPVKSEATSAAGVSAADMAYLRQLVLDHSQNVLDPSRDFLFATRLTRLMRQHGQPGLTDFVQFLKLKRNPALERAVAEAMTINETSFFRDGRPFELLRTQLLPGLIEARRPIRTLRLWSAACSTGQEAYSLAMMLSEHFPHITGAFSGWSVRIEGTDLSLEVVERCQAGRYHRLEVNRGLPARNIVRFFDHQGEDWTVKPELRRLTHFRQANLCSDNLPFSPLSGRFDVVFLRNVMLYFSLETRKKLLANVHRLLAPDGLLFLGSSEQPADPSLWTATLAGGTCYYQPRQST